MFGVCPLDEQEPLPGPTASQRSEPYVVLELQELISADLVPGPSPAVVRLVAKLSGLCAALLHAAKQAAASQRVAGLAGMSLARLQSRAA